MENVISKNSFGSTYVKIGSKVFMLSLLISSWSSVGFYGSSSQTEGPIPTIVQKKGFGPAHEYRMFCIHPFFVNDDNGTKHVEFFKSFYLVYKYEEGLQIPINYRNLCFCKIDNAFCDKNGVICTLSSGTEYVLKSSYTLPLYTPQEYKRYQEQINSTSIPIINGGDPEIENFYLPCLCCYNIVPTGDEYVAFCNEKAKKPSQGYTYYAELMIKP